MKTNKKTFTVRAISTLLALTFMVASLCLLMSMADAAETPAKLHIAFVYGGALDEKGAVTKEVPAKNSFVEIYNPNDFEVSLSGYYLHYQGYPTQLAANRTGTQWDALALNPAKSIPARCSYLIDCGNAADPVPAAVTIPAFDQTWAPEPGFVTKGAKYVITYGVSSIPAATVDPFTAGSGGAPIEGYIDGLGSAGNDADTTDLIDGCEFAFLKTSKQLGLMRIDRDVDTDNNAVDFKTVDFRTVGCALPRSLADGPNIPPVADDLLIAFVYGGSVSETGSAASDVPVSNSFIELYNPTEETVSLSGYYLHYQGFPTQQIAKRTGDTWAVLALNPAKSIPAKHSYLIDCGATQSNNRIVLTFFDQAWSPSPNLCTKGAKYVLTKGVSSIPATTVDPFTAGAGGKPITGYVDMLGSAGNDSNTTDQIDGCETAFLLTSKQLGLVRSNRNTDTDNNANDFKVVDFRLSGCDIPRSLADGPIGGSGQPVKMVFSADYAIVGKPFSVKMQNAAPDETFTYTWTIGGAVVPGQTTETYTPVLADLQKFIRIKAVSDAN
ncbi:MAG: hypothetical protein FWD16_07695, partial [Clostridia bacterium]|nr:hypothetical protein [Clostridia bacterium]